MHAVIASIPSPPWNAIHLGPLQIHFYGLMIAIGVIVAIAWADGRFVERGGPAGEIGRLAAWAVPGGVLGARAYHVITDFELYTHHPWRAFAIWDGGLGIPGGMAAGVITGLVVAHHRHLSLSALLDAVAPTLPLAQAIGRWGNWFNQELFGRPSTLPWAVRIDVAHRPAGLSQVSSFAPTFLYESLWNLGVVAVVLVVERRALLRPGRLFAVYVAGYALGRFFVERMRVDFAHTIGGLRVNEWVSVLALLVAAAFLATGRAARGRASARSASDHPLSHGGSVRRFDLVIFDCDGVLVDSERLIVKVEAQICQERGWGLTEDDVIREFVGLSDSAMRARLSELVGEELDENWDAEYTERYRNALTQDLVAIPGVAAAIDAIERAGVATCVASSGSHQKMDLTLGITGLLARFEGRIFSATDPEVERGKPAPDLFLHAAARMGVDPDRCAVVEDSPFGLVAALEAGMVPFGFSGSVIPAERLALDGVTVFDSMSELPALVTGA